jgi:hypothetical protein
MLQVKHFLQATKWRPNFGSDILRYDVHSPPCIIWCSFIHNLILESLLTSKNHTLNKNSRVNAAVFICIYQYFPLWIFNVKHLAECRAHSLLDKLSILFSTDKILFCFGVQMLSTPTVVESIIIWIWVMVSISWKEMFVLLWMISCISAKYRGFKVFYNRRYFLNFRRYLKN